MTDRRNWKASTYVADDPEDTDAELPLKLGALTPGSSP